MVSYQRIVLLLLTYQKLSKNKKHPKIKLSSKFSKNFISKMVNDFYPDTVRKVLPSTYIQ